MFRSDTIAAVATPMSSAGIGIIRVSGEEAVSVVEQIFCPAKKGKNNDEHYPYVLVCLDEEEIEDEDSEILVTVYFQVGIIDKNPNKQGHFDVANVMNRLAKRFLENRIVNQRYRINFPLIKKFQEDDTWPKFIGGMATFWTVAAPKIRETEYD